jgi:hypothetical protein
MSWPGELAEVEYSLKRWYTDPDFALNKSKKNNSLNPVLVLWKK